MLRSLGMTKEYAVHKGEQILTIGTLEECAKELNVTPKTILFYGTPAYARRTSEEKARRTVRI